MRTQRTPLWRTVALENQLVSISFIFWDMMYINHTVLLVSQDYILRLLGFLLLLLSNTSPPVSATLPRDLLFNFGIRCHDVSALLINCCLEQVPSLQSVLLITAQMLSSWLSTILVYRNPLFIFHGGFNYCKSLTKMCIFSISTAWPIYTPLRMVWQKSLFLHK